MNKNDTRSYQHIYTFTYDHHEAALSKLESRHLFQQEDDDKLLFSNIKIAPSDSAFIKNRLDILLTSDDYTDLLDQIETKKICIEGFKVEYLVLNGDTTAYPERLKKVKAIGYRIEGEPEYYHPTVTYGLSYYEGIWYFGIWIKDKFVWRQHNKKPHSYSNSIAIHIAKALVNIATKADKSITLLDTCCGAGTIMLEACFAGYDIEGCDINWKWCRDARKNLAHFNYDTIVYRSDIKDIEKRYDAAIVDLPYNLLSSATDSDILHIIQSTTNIAGRMVIVSIEDIRPLIEQTGLKILDYCTVGKGGKTSFTRKIWVCEQ